MGEKKQHRNRLRFYFAWDFKKEEQWMDEMSAKGEHMDRLSVLRYRFLQDDQARYVYRYDFQNVRRASRKFDEYVELYAEAGWEYVGTIGFWHCFRRPYVPGETIELYTDKASIKQFYKRIQMMFAAVLLLNLPILAMNATNSLLLESPEGVRSMLASVTILQAAAVLILAYGMFRIRQRIRD